jgi:hypothetical protein
MLGAGDASAASRPGSFTLVRLLAAPFAHERSDANVKDGAVVRVAETGESIERCCVSDVGAE